MHIQKHLFTNTYGSCKIKKTLTDVLHSQYHYIQRETKEKVHLLQDSLAEVLQSHAKKIIV